MCLFILRHRLFAQYQYFNINNIQITIVLGWFLGGVGSLRHVRSHRLRVPNYWELKKHITVFISLSVHDN